MAIVDPHGWSFLQYGDQTGWIDFLGAHELQHRAFADTIIRVLGHATFPSLPLGDYTGPEWHDAHQLVHDGEAAALALTAAPDLRSYDLADREQWASYHWIHALEHVRIRGAAGL